jgi:signal transduction histidine kinase
VSGAGATIRLAPVPVRAHYRRRASRPYLISLVALVGLGATVGAMLGFDQTATLGAVAFAPWVGLIGFDAGVRAGILASAGSTGLWLLATWQDPNVATGSGTQLGVRFAYLALLGAGVGLVGELLKRSERAHVTVRALQSSLIDATLDGICLTDRSGNILIANQPLVRMALELGMPAHGTVLERLMAVADKMAEPERYRERMLEIGNTPGEATVDEFELSGTGRVFRGYTAPVHSDAGDFEGRIWTLREVTADRELDRMRDAFVATVSHELRTPLTSISGFLELMEDEQHQLGEAGRTYLEVIRRSTDRLHNLVEDLLLVAQIEARRVELDRAPVDLSLLAERAVEAARPTADDKGVTLAMETDHAPAVLGDIRRLTQVLDNLVSNAIKFTEGGGRVTVSVERRGDSALLVVSDTGIGVPADEQGQVFSRFFRSRSATQRAIPGTGLGLAICHALVEGHGGSIALASREGEGTKVTVTLPAYG